MKKTLLLLLVLSFVSCTNQITKKSRTRTDFNKDWNFYLGDVSQAKEIDFKDDDWRKLKLPHDWSIEGTFSHEHPAGIGGGALPGGTAWYRKHFSLNKTNKDKLFFIEFDGIYANSEVWINGNYLGKRPNGYISFRYNLSPFLNFGDKENVIAVKVNNAQQPNSRWYSGAGIYRNVWLTSHNKVYINQWGTYITTPKVDKETAEIAIELNLVNKENTPKDVLIKTIIYNPNHTIVAQAEQSISIPKGEKKLAKQSINVPNPALWSINTPQLYKAIHQLFIGGKEVDSYETSFGIRTFNFDAEKGFSLNDSSMKINGVCLHHDLGCLGAAFNTRAMERQLEIMKAMGANGIRTSHNPPAPELLDLCDKMGFIVQNETFDMWKMKKMRYDYALDWDEWHVKDLEDHIVRDRNHPSVFTWSIGNEILEQWDSTGKSISTELASIVRKLDNRPITSACNDPQPNNNIIQSGALDLIGYNYHHQDFEAFPQTFPQQKFIATETVSALATRGHYDHINHSDTIRRWPISWDKPFETGNPDNTVSAYDHVSTPWGSTHEETLKIMKKHDFLSGMYIWTGFDYLGEPTPYTWPSRSSYFGIVDLAGFPKDVYYLYQSEWTDQEVLHIFPHWNWEGEDSVDVWAYSNAEEVELFLNGQSLGSQSKKGDDLHLQWKVPYQEGQVIALGKRNGVEISRDTIQTAKEASKISLEADRKSIKADGNDLVFITIKVQDEQGVTHPNTDNLIEFSLEGEGIIIGVDNGDPTSHDSFKAKQRKAFHGLALVVIQSTEKKGNITLQATSEGLTSASINISSY